ncbi:MAG: hypothetical protein KJ955_00975 [Nanoarchaeota archaeon]|nr:hypothetical protein [Nanoarchaeota archaeon]
MLEGISGIKGMKEQLDAIEKKIAGLEDANKAVETALSSISKNMEEAKNSQQGYVQQFASDLERIKELQKEFEKALRTFQQNNAQLYESVYNKMHKELNEHMMPAKIAAGEFNAVLPEIKSMQQSAASVKEEMSRLAALAQGIKKDDFELKQYAHELLKMDTEKLRLMKEIETLKKIISYERRRQR